LSRYGKGEEFKGEESEKTADMVAKGGKARVFQVADSRSINHAFYFTNSSFVDEKTVAFTSHRSGEPNIFMAHIGRNRIVQLTESGDVNAYSPVATGKEIFYTTRNKQVKGVSVKSLEERVLASFGEADGLGGLSINRKHSLLATCVGKGEQNRIVLVPTDGGQAETVLKTKVPVGHVQIHPVDDDLILYSGPITQRMWLARRSEGVGRPLYRHPPTEWLTHEMWIGASKRVMVVHWPYALRSVHIDDDRKLDTIVEMNCWHPSSNSDGSKIVCDTARPDIGLQIIDPKTGKHEALCYPRSSSGGTQWDFNIPADPEKEKLTESTYGPQWTHPHPSFSPGDDKVVFTSDMGRKNKSQVFVAFIL